MQQQTLSSPSPETEAARINSIVFFPNKNKQFPRNQIHANRTKSEDEKLGDRHHRHPVCPSLIIPKIESLKQSQNNSRHHRNKINAKQQRT
ncbi:hypothetical protein Nepgr_023108 [Nepenthes gracilis]|uniref:Uncharacterized protein n=1 Tax=Nepenthes gracilis TaxID=150966 RepID=A0AAD3T283_NEPGR|nr:hypothetical protein Nepgr_023108 [Nepenthes gracilis]